MLKPAVALVTATALLLGAGRLALGQGGSDTLAVDVSVSDAAAQLAAAEADVEDLRTQLAVLRLERTEYSRRLRQRHGRLNQAADDLRAARTTAQRLAVQAYMGAGSTPSPETVAFADGDPLEYVFRTTLVADSTNARYRAADYYHELRDQAHDAVRTTVDHLDDLDEAIALTELALGEAEDAERTAAVVLAEAEAEAEAAERAARQAAAVPAPSSSSEPPPDGYVPLGQWPGGPSYDQWAALRNCESSGNYQAVSPSGLYRGAYQFDLGTWASVGGSGDPAVASPEEQDHRAQVLWSQRGSSPWPVCGRYLD
ncbi:MAG TPA: transglycosylase family protein [Acidimicrobiales bacterium]|nr:transglycosylase family protein [Acidimicrobiales bacterium]